MSDQRPSTALAEPRTVRGEKLSGRQKAAVLLVALGPERAAEMFGHLRDDEMEALSLEMAKIQRLDTQLLAG